MYVYRYRFLCVAPRVEGVAFSGYTYRRFFVCVDRFSPCVSIIQIVLYLTSGNW